MVDRCPLCQGAGREWLKKNSYSLLQCARCGHRFFLPPSPSDHIQTVYGDHYFADSSEGYVDYLGEEEIQRASARYYIRRLRQHRPEAASVIDIGAACGFFLKEFKDAGWQVLGIEPNATMREIAKNRFDVQTVGGSMDELPKGMIYQLISAIQVISHLMDPLDFVTQARDRLSESGLLLIETWDRDSIAAKTSGARWHELNPPSVLHWFSRASLRKMVCDTGFELIDCGLPRKRIQIGRAFRMLRHSHNDSAISRGLTWPLALMPKNLTLPYLLGDAFWMLFKKRR